MIDVQDAKELKPGNVLMDEVFRTTVEVLKVFKPKRHPEKVTLVLRYGKNVFYATEKSISRFCLNPLESRKRMEIKDDKL